LDLRLRELRFLPPFFALRLADRLADFLLPPFLAEAFLREERLLGAMVPKTGDYEFETNLRTAQPGGTKHKKIIQKGITKGSPSFGKLLWKQYIRFIETTRQSREMKECPLFTTRKNTCDDTHTRTP
jgi:hypothetical protein